MPEYRVFGSEELPAVLDIYREAGWLAYLSDAEKLKRAFDHSLYCLGCYEHGCLAGFVRCVGDGEHVVLVQDLIVRPVFRRRGIGTGLMKEALRHFADVRFIPVITDTGYAAANAFYRALGLKTLESGGMTAYFR